MVWISLLMVLVFNVNAQSLPKFLTKHSIATIRFISSDGRFSYILKRPGVLGLVSSFRSIDFISDSASSDFIVKDSRFNRRIVIETIPTHHINFNMLKEHKISVVEWGEAQPKSIGSGINSQLHLQDEWISYFRPYHKIIVLQNVITQKTYEIKLSDKKNPYYRPYVEMINPETVVYTDINDKGHAALIQYNLLTKKSIILYRSNQTATNLELCQSKDYLAMGEFPFDGVNRNSRISRVGTKGSSISGFTTVYNSNEQDLGNMICTEDAIYFVKTISHDKKLNLKRTEAARLDLKKSKVEIKSDFIAVAQIISMDGKVMIPFRGDYFVLEGNPNLTDDKLRGSPVNPQEELPLEI